MIIDKPMIKKSYTYKLTILDTETGEEKEFLPIHIKEFQLNIYIYSSFMMAPLYACTHIWSINFFRQI